MIKDLNELKAKFQHLLDQKQAQRQGNTTIASKEVKGKIARLMELNAQKKKIYEDVDKCEGNKGELMRKKELCMKKIDKKYNTEELVRKGLKEGKKILETTSGGYQVEEKYLKQEKFLKESIKHI